MEWLTTNSQMHNAFAPLGSQRGKNYVVNEECQSKYSSLVHLFYELLVWVNG